MAMLTPPPTKPITLRGRKKIRIRERSELREDRAYDCGSNSGSLRDAIGSLKKRTQPPLELYIT